MLPPNDRILRIEGEEFLELLDEIILEEVHIFGLEDRFEFKSYETRVIPEIPDAYLQKKLIRRFQDLLYEALINPGEKDRRFRSLSDAARDLQLEFFPKEDKDLLEFYSADQVRFASEFVKQRLQYFLDYDENLRILLDEYETDQDIPKALKGILEWAMKNDPQYRIISGQGFGEVVFRCYLGLLYWRYCKLDLSDLKQNLADEKAMSLMIEKECDFYNWANPKKFDADIQRLADAFGSLGRL